MKLHYDFKVKLRIRKKEKMTPYGCRIREGDNLAGTLFITVMQANEIKIEK